MKKKIKIFSDKVEKLLEQKDGTLHGGFASLKGGFNDSMESTNNNCTNDPVGCTNGTNKGGGIPCANSAICFI